jgi:alkylhydroperoxidase family enzyme
MFPVIKKEWDMARISSVPFVDVPDSLKNVMHAYDDELGGSEFVQVFSHAPEIYKSFVDYYFSLVLETRGAISGELTELVRLMVAKHNDCFLWIHARLAVARQEGLTEEKIAAIGDYADSKMFTQAEKSALQYAEAIAGDMSNVSDKLFDILREHFTESEIIDLGMRIQTFVGYGRLIRVLDLEVGKSCPLWEYF